MPVNERSIISVYRCAFLIGSSCREKRNSYSIVNNELLSYFINQQPIQDFLSEQISKKAVLHIIAYSSPAK